MSSRTLYALKTVSAYSAALCVATFFGFPVFWMISAALKTDAEVASYPPVFWFQPTLINFTRLLHESTAITALTNSILIVSISTVIAAAMGTLAAYALARLYVPNKNVIAVEILAVRMLPPIVSVIPLFLLAKHLGVFDTPYLLIAVYALNGLPFVVWIIRVFVYEIPKSIEEAALVDGCSVFGAFWRVTLPLLMPGMAATMIIVFMFSWNEYLLASILTSQDAKTLPVIAANAIKPKAISWGLASAAGVLMSVPVVALVLFMQKYLVRGLTLGAVKG